MVNRYADREYYDRLRMMMFGDEGLEYWTDSELKDKESFIRCALDEIRADLSDVFDQEYESYLFEKEEREE